MWSAQRRSLHLPSLHPHPHSENYSFCMFSLFNFSSIFQGASCCVLTTFASMCGRPCARCNTALQNLCFLNYITRGSDLNIYLFNLFSYFAQNKGTVKFQCAKEAGTATQKALTADLQSTKILNRIA